MAAAPNDAVVVSYPRDDVALITLNRPNKMNAMNQDLIDGIYAACDEIDAQPKLRVAILTGEGRGFCAGADLGGFGIVPGTEELGQIQQWFGIQQKITGLIPRLQHLKIPVIAAVNGAAAGGGFALVLGCEKMPRGFFPAKQSSQATVYSKRPSLSRLRSRKVERDSNGTTSASIQGPTTGRS